MVYISHHDKALSFSNWLFEGGGRLGDLNVSTFDKSELEVLQRSKRLQLIDAREPKPGMLGHSYFHTNPAVSSDLVLVMRYQLLPGIEHGRPLGASDLGLWFIGDKYPGLEWTLPEGVGE